MIKIFYYTFKDREIGCLGTIPVPSLRNNNKFILILFQQLYIQNIKSVGNKNV